MPMRFIRVLGVALAFASTSALAFQEQQMGTAPAAGTAAPAAPAAPDSGLGLNKGEAAVDKAAGTEVRIPGLGKLGVLPKMDFGLELLYGANEGAKQPEVQRELPDDELTIRGSLKHNF